MTTLAATDRDTPADVLCAVVASREAARLAEVGSMIAAIEWADMHPAESLTHAATVPGTDRAIAIAGDGAPLVAEFALVELATALGRSAESARIWLGATMEIRFRLPRIWHALTHGSLEPWRARQIAAETIALPSGGADWVDAQVAHVAHTVGPAQLRRTVAEAVRRFDPDLAYEAAVAAAEDRHVTIHDREIIGGCVAMTAVLDVADARDLEAAVAKGAHEMLLHGSIGSLDVRRAQALGEIARHELALDLGAEGTGRDATVYIHVDRGALDAEYGDPAVARVEGGDFLIDIDRMREWLSVRGTRVSIRPVIDLEDDRISGGYGPSEVLREQVVLRDGRCVFPHCNRAARRADLDHIEPYASGGDTASSNLAPLCRLHHRAKTHGGWSYTTGAPGEYAWFGPHGQSFFTTRATTSPLAPPRQRTRP
ncbi:hypothetical protein Back2_02390 [Nocardioides baekrokdamisoli]|uniref:HNH nuclease domain-containing protein n=1 Tax=Nocardioides baekrokdamisoli TaxID=1804624 RepID=A0A3G9IC90_9ACTN|nr:HNH endonuclease signature motif containing protein [Nocardioides baekrokdamisoli]BBH15952.1 hypothetical protein Back2_02390 [Nocardioides baekrokdamisoli]